MQNIIVTPIELSELKELIFDSLQDALQKHTASLAIAKPEIVDGTAIERKFDITRQTLARWRKQKRIPFIQHGGIIRYDLIKVIEALEKRKGERG